jgi:hypothetical protein
MQSRLRTPARAAGVAPRGRLDAITATAGSIGAVYFGPGMRGNQRCLTSVVPLSIWGRFRHTSLIVPFLADVSHARALLVLYGDWFGGPVVEFNKTVIDGRLRLAAWDALFASKPAPRIVARNRYHAGCLLCAAQHFARAVEVLGDRVSYDSTLPAMLHLPLDMVAPLIALKRGPSPWELHRRTQQHRPQRRTMQVVTNVRQLYLRALEDGLQLTPQHLREALGEWL